MHPPTARCTRGRLVPRPAALLAAAGLLTAAPAGAQTTWQGGAGVWSDPDNWDPAVPTATSQVLIDDGNATASDVALDTITTINGLTLDADDLLRIRNGQRLRFDGTGASLENHGLIQHEGTGFTWLRVFDDLAVTGTGTIRLNGGSNQLNGGFSSTLDHGPDHTIEGAGTVGSGIDVVNRGLIHGNVNGSPLTIQSQNTFENNGIVRASNGATVNVFSNDNTGSGGRYEAVGPGSRVVFFSNTEIHDAVFAGTGGGVISPDAFNLGRTMDLHDGVNEGRFDAADTFLHGSFTNSGTVRLLNAQTLSWSRPSPSPGAAASRSSRAATSRAPSPWTTSTTPWRASATWTWPRPSGLPRAWPPAPRPTPPTSSTSTRPSPSPAGWPSTWRAWRSRTPRPMRARSTRAAPGPPSSSTR